MGLIQGFLPAVMRAVTKATEYGLDEAKAMSSGTTSLKQLAMEGNPYALRHGDPLRPLLPINVQKGNFLAAWQRKPTISQAGEVSSRIENRSPEADFLAGKDRPKSTMFRRPIDDEVEACMEPELERQLTQTLGDLCRNAQKL